MSDTIATISFRCPHCGADESVSSTELQIEVLCRQNEWTGGLGSSVTCPSCGKVVDLEITLKDNG